MAVLGVGGRIVLKRTPPLPELLSYSSINRAQNTYSLTQKGYRNGDLVEIASTTNWPNASAGDGMLVPAYISTIPAEWRPNLELVDYSIPYDASLGASPYRNQLYIGVDQNNVIAFYRDRASALGNVKSERENLSSINPSDAIEFRLVNDWRLECGLVSWNLNTNADILETTNLGEAFFNGVKGKISGQGQFDFIVQREFYDPKNAVIITVPSYNNAVLWTNLPSNTTYQDAKLTDNTPNTTGSYNNAVIAGTEPAPTKYQLMARTGTSNLMRLLLQSQDQSEVEAEFWLIPGEDERGMYEDKTLEPGDLFYRTTILITATAVSTVVADLIKGSASFVTVGAIDLLEGLP